MRMHRDAVAKIDDACPLGLKEASQDLWDKVVVMGERYGYRNAQATVLAPTGTISFLMDCDTTGIEPDIALVKYKQLAGGGMLKIVNQTVPLALESLGYDGPTVQQILDYIDKNDTIEGTSLLEDEHLAVFDCAFTPRNGSRSIRWQAHVHMMAAAQPFLSGAISKTVNMPRDSTVEDIGTAYFDGWKLGLKALAIYRDGSKESQPLSTSTEADKAKAKQVAAPRRERLNDTRRSVTHKFSVAGHEGYITVGLYDDGRPGEVFLTMAKEGSTIGGLMDCFGTAISMGLQFGVPMEVFVNKFSHTRFEPMGHTQNPDIRIAKSIVDYIFRWMGIQFMPGFREANLGLPAADAANQEEAGETDSRPAAKKVGGPKSGAATPNAMKPNVSTPNTMKPNVSTTNAAKPGSSAASASVANGYGTSSGTNGHGTTKGHGQTEAQDANAALLDRAGVAMKPRAQGDLASRDDQFARFQADAPSCDNCGAITVRNGNCYLCHNCGNSMGCS
jgi:ribonucleoside-diphosphate reductase alpha chain